MAENKTMIALLVGGVIGGVAHYLFNWFHGSYTNTVKLVVNGKIVHECYCPGLDDITEGTILHKFTPDGVVKPYVTKIKHNEKK